MMRRRIAILVVGSAALLFLCTLAGCAAMGPFPGKDPLPSWNEGENKQDIIAFVEAVASPEKPSYMRPEDRIAVFDNDGTLMCEKPVSVPETFVFDSAVGMLQKHPELADCRPYTALKGRDCRAAMEQLSYRELGELSLAPFVGQTPEAYGRSAEAFLAKARHPHFQVPYTATAYLPMVELVDYLRSRGFSVYIVSGGVTGLIRAFSPDMYGISAEHVIGTTAMLRYAKRDGTSVLFREASYVMPINDREGKPVNIWLRIGKRPVVAVGNSDGDLPMLEFTADRSGPSMVLLVHHDDEMREFRYDAGAEKVLKEARQRDWNVVSIKEDFARVFGFPE